MKFIRWNGDLGVKSYYEDPLGWDIVIKIHDFNQDPSVENPTLNLNLVSYGSTVVSSTTNTTHFPTIGDRTTS